MADNIFESLSNKYFNYVKDLKELGSSMMDNTTFLHPETGLSFFAKRKWYKEETRRKEIADEFDLLMATFKLYATDKEYNSEFFEYVLLYAKFLRTAEKCFMWNNEDSSMIYSEELSDKNKWIIYFNIENKKYKIRIEYETSEIRDPNRSYLDNYLNGTSSNIIFISMDIKREFGKMMVNKFKFILGEQPKFNDNSDYMLLDNIKFDIMNSIGEWFKQIMKFVSRNAVKLSWKEVIEDGVWIRRDADFK